MTLEERQLCNVEQKYLLFNPICGKYPNIRQKYLTFRAAVKKRAKCEIKMHYIRAIQRNGAQWKIKMHYICTTDMRIALCRRFGLRGKASQRDFFALLRPLNP